MTSAVERFKTIGDCRVEIGPHGFSLAPAGHHPKDLERFQAIVRQARELTAEELGDYKVTMHRSSDAGINYYDLIVFYKTA